ncbi:MAG TPA: L,D-transpeptidase family protein [Bacteroidia bacterium]|nr:L,D-transpeptidase family protein [Bacteroidia bacterium]
MILKHILCFLTLLFAIVACKNHPDKSAPVSGQAEDTTGLFRQRVAELFTDSEKISLYFSSHPDFFPDSGKVGDFYRRRFYRYAWINQDGIIENTSHLINLLSNTRVNFTADSILISRLKALHDSLTQMTAGLLTNSELVHETELTFTATFYFVARKEFTEINDSLFRSLEWFIPRRKVNYEGLLDSVLISPVGSVMKMTEPVYFMYQKLKEQLDKYARLVCFEEWPVIPEPEKELKAGESDSSLLLIKNRLHVLGDLDALDSSLVFSETLQEGIRKFQSRFGIEQNGRLVKQVYDELNVSLNSRIHQILINMERCRWLPERPYGPHILINIPEFKLHVYEKEQVLWECNVIVGKTTTNTVIFTDSLEYIVFCPYWNVPKTIVRDEIVPEMVKNPSYLKKHKMEIITYGSPYLSVSPSSVNWNNYLQATFPYMIRQQPGATNALGRIKFLFPNNYNIYLHDTPEKSLFARQARSFSHGCIRIEEPLKLAEYLLETDSAWSKDKIWKAMTAGKEKHVKLKRKIPVYILYFTAWVDEQGLLNFRKDLYGHDNKMEQVLFESSEMESMQE